MSKESVEICEIIKLAKYGFTQETRDLAKAILDAMVCLDKSLSTLAKLSAITDGERNV